MCVMCSLLSFFFQFDALRLVPPCGCGALNIYSQKSCNRFFLFLFDEHGRLGYRLNCTQKAWIHAGRKIEVQHNCWCSEYHRNVIPHPNQSTYGKLKCKYAPTSHRWGYTDHLPVWWRDPLFIWRDPFVSFDENSKTFRSGSPVVYARTYANETHATKARNEVP